MKNCKTFYEAQTASHLKEITLPPHLTREKLTTSLQQKFFYVDIQKYTDICFQNASKMQFFGA